MRGQGPSQALVGSANRLAQPHDLIGPALRAHRGQDGDDARRAGEPRRLENCGMQESVLIRQACDDGVGPLILLDFVFQELTGLGLAHHVVEGCDDDLFIELISAGVADGTFKPVKYPPAQIEI